MKKTLFLISLIVLALITLQTNAEEDVCQGCINGDECVSFGSQIIVNDAVFYCSIDKELVSAKGAGQSCQNNFECANEFCSYGSCSNSKYQEISAQKSVIEYIREALFGTSQPASSNQGSQPSGGGSSGGSSRRSSSSSCTSNWECTDFSICVDGKQSRSCIDTKGCNTNLPLLEKPCGASDFVCNEAWQCTSWSECIDGVQQRACSDLNLCGTYLNKPIISQACSAPGSSKAPLAIVVIIILAAISLIYWYFIRFKQG